MSFADAGQARCAVIRFPMTALKSAWTPPRDAICLTGFRTRVKRSKRPRMSVRASCPSSGRGPSFDGSFFLPQSAFFGAFRVLRQGLGLTSYSIQSGPTVAGARGRGQPQIGSGAGAAGWLGPRPAACRPPCPSCRPPSLFAFGAQSDSLPAARLGRIQSARAIGKDRRAQSASLRDRFRALISAFSELTSLPSHSMPILQRRTGHHCGERMRRGRLRPLGQRPFGITNRRKLFGGDRIVEEKREVHVDYGIGAAQRTVQVTV